MTDKQTVGEIARLWKEDKRKYVKYSTFAAYALILEDHILPEFEEKTEIRERDVQEFVLKKIKNGLSAKSVKDILVVLRMIMSFGDRSGAWEYERWRIKFPTERTMPRMEILDIEDHRRLLQHLQEQPSLQNLGIYMSLTTGMRIGEICALKWDDIDLGAGIISVRRTIERIYTVETGVRHTELVIGPPKTPHSIREIPITAKLKNIRILESEAFNRYLPNTSKISNNECIIVFNKSENSKDGSYTFFSEFEKETIGNKQIVWTIFANIMCSLLFGVFSLRSWTRGQEWYNWLPWEYWATFICLLLLLAYLFVPWRKILKKVKKYFK